MAWPSGVLRYCTGENLIFLEVSNSKIASGRGESNDRERFSRRMTLSSRKRTQSSCHFDVGYLECGSLELHHWQTISVQTKLDSLGILSMLTYDPEVIYICTGRQPLIELCRPEQRSWRRTIVCPHRARREELSCYLCIHVDNHTVYYL